MKIDTTYKAGAMIVTMMLSFAEAEWANDLLARIGCNQHRLVWIHDPEDPDDGTADVGKKDPATFRLPLEYQSYRVTRRPVADGQVAKVTYRLTT